MAFDHQPLVEAAKKAMETLKNLEDAIAADPDGSYLLMSMNVRQAATEFRAAVTPETFLQLCAEHDRLAAEVERLREALEEAVIDLSNTRTNIMVDLAKGNDRWEGVPDLMKPRIDSYRAALERTP